MTLNIQVCKRPAYCRPRKILCRFRRMAGIIRPITFSTAVEGLLTMLQSEMPAGATVAAFCIELSQSIDISM